MGIAWAGREVRLPNNSGGVLTEPARPGITGQSQQLKGMNNKTTAGLPFGAESFEHCFNDQRFQKVWS
jgi:hypothetical protein